MGKAMSDIKLLSPEYMTPEDRFLFSCDILLILFMAVNINFEARLSSFEQAIYLCLRNANEVFKPSEISIQLPKFR